MKNMKYLRKVITASIILLLFSLKIVVSQNNNFEIGYGLSAWGERNQRELPEVTKTHYLNNNLQIGYKMLPFLSIGLSANYYYDKYYSKRKHIVLPDELLFLYWTNENKIFGAGPYMKLSFGESFNYSFSTEYNYTIGSAYTNSVEEWQFGEEYYNSKGEYNTQFLAFNVGIGKQIGDNLSVNLFFREQYIFFRKWGSASPGIFESYFQPYIGAGVEFFFNIKNKK